MSQSPLSKELIELLKKADTSRTKHFMSHANVQK